jgi:hypothetical protein
MTPASRAALSHVSAWLVRFGEQGDGYLAPQVFPRPGGGLQLEWSAEGADVELAVAADGSISILATESSVGIDFFEEYGAGHVADLAPAAVRVYNLIVERVRRLQDVTQGVIPQMSLRQIRAGAGYTKLGYSELSGAELWGKTELAELRRLRIRTIESYLAPLGVEAFVVVIYPDGRVRVLQTREPLAAAHAER